MAEPKTRPTAASVTKFLASQKPEARRTDCEALVAMLTKATKQKPVLWGASIVGFGATAYVGASGKSVDWPVVAFAPRKAALTLYLMGTLGRHPELLDKLGRHKSGKGCLYIGKLADVDLKVLERLVALAYRENLKC